MAAVSLIDYLITLPREVEHVWACGFNRRSFLFFLNRYPSLLGGAIYSALYFTSALGENDSVNPHPCCACAS
jgi:hypothetical protein